jgi:hypothetical protein
MSTPNPEDAAPTGAMPFRFRATLSTLVGLAAVLAAACAWMQAEASRKESEALVDGARQAVEILRKISASQIRLGAGDNAAQLADLLENRSRLHGDLPAGVSPASSALGRADSRTARRIAESFNRATDAARVAELLDEATAESVATSVFELQPLVRSQNRAVDRAGRFGTQQSRASLALALTAVAAALLGLAGLVGANRAGRIAIASASVGLALAVGWSVAGLLA